MKLLRPVNWFPRWAKRSIRHPLPSPWGAMVLGLALSITIHGLVLGLPGWQPRSPASWPSTVQSQETGNRGGEIVVTRLPDPGASPSAPAAPTPPPTTNLPSVSGSTSGFEADPVSAAPVPDILDADGQLAIAEESVNSPPAEHSDPPVASAPTTETPPSAAALPEATGVTNPAPSERLSDAAVPLEVRLQDFAAYTYDGSKVLKAGDMAISLQDWTGEGQFFPTKVDPLVIPYVLGDICLETPPTSGVLAVILAVDGTPQRGPVIISSTGYPILDEKAQAMILAKAHPFPDRVHPTGYSLEIRVDYPARC